MRCYSASLQGTRKGLSNLRIIVGCERTQVVTQAFRALGHQAFSCDIEPTEGNPAWHLQGDIRDQDLSGYELGIFHPDCTYLTVAGNRWWAGSKERLAAVKFVQWIWDLPIPRLCIENPIGVLSKLFQKPSQYIHPWQFGHGETKKTCLFFRGLKPLIPTKIVPGRVPRIWKMGPSKKYNRKHERSRTYQGWADAMAAQWGKE